LCEGRSGVGEITRFDTAEFTTKIAAEVKDFNAEDFLPKKDAKRTEKFIAYAVAGARMAVENARLTIDNSNGPRIGVITGCGLGGLEMLETTARTVQEKGPKRCSPFFIPRLIGNMAPGMISIHLGAKGPNISVATACAAGAHAIGDACNTILRGQADAMITGGVESVITPTCIAGFNAMKALSTRNDDPQKASRPFDRDRDGFMVGEGAGILILEDLEHALARGATILAEMAGYGQSGDGYHMTSPSPDGDGMIRCMQAAIDSAGISCRCHRLHQCPRHVHPVERPVRNPGHQKSAWRESAKVPVSSTKSMTGHLLGGAGGIETAFTVLALKNGIIPPTINLENPDDECDLDYVPKVARKADITYAMSNSFGFGGTNASLVVKRYIP
jgi:3-oxoacyl-[acyl-carrier-protein] synthase II